MVEVETRLEWVGDERRVEEVRCKQERMTFQKFDSEGVEVTELQERNGIRSRLCTFSGF